MSLKRVLGIMLASRMAGRGRGRGGLGRAAMLGGLGSRGIGRKAGIAGLGYMAYQAYRDHQARTAQQQPAGTNASAGTTGHAGATGTGTTGTGTGAAAGGGLGAMVKNLADQVSEALGSQSSQSSRPAQGAPGSPGAPAAASGPAAAPAAENADERAAADSLSDDTALLLIRAMVTAAYSDGSLSQEERARIMGHIEEAGGDADDRAVMEREIANPRPLDELLAQVNDEETALEFYVASRAALDGDTEHDRAYLARLRERLNISAEDAAEAEDLAS